MATGRIITRPRTPIAAQLLRSNEKPRHPVKINKNHPHADDLRFWMPCLPGQDGRQGRDLDVTDLNEVSLWDTGIDRDPRNGSILPSSNTEQIQIANSATISPAYLTILANINISEGERYEKTILHKDTIGWVPPYFSYGIRVQQQSENRVLFVVGDGSDLMYAFAATNSMVGYYGKDIWVALTWDGTLLNGYVFDESGVLIASAANSGAISGPIGYFDTDLYIFESIHGGSYGGFDAGDAMYDLRLWGHAKTESELRDIIVQYGYDSLIPKYGRDFVYKFERKQRHPLFFGTNF